MNKIDLYAIHNLDRQRTPEALGAQLTAQRNAAADTLAHSRIDTARAILSDPGLRARYDAMLADPTATVDESTLAAIAGRPVPQASRRSPFAEPKARILAGAAALIALVLVIAVIAVVAGGGGDDAGTTATDQGKPSSPSSSSSGVTRADREAWRGKTDNDDLKRADWPDDEAPNATVHLTKATALPVDVADAFANNFNDCDAVTCRIEQYQDKSIGVYAKPTLALYGQDGALMSTKTYLPTELPAHFDRAHALSAGYFHVTADAGIEIPAAAAGNAEHMNYAIGILPDAFDDTKFWVLLRGGTAVYQADVRATPEWLDEVSPR